MSDGRLSNGIEVITPVFVARALGSISWPISTGCIDDLFEYRDEREPAALPGGARFSSPPYPSYRSSTGFSLCSFLPKNDLPAEVCLDLSVADVEVGMLTGDSGGMKGAAWAFIHNELPPPPGGFP